MKVILDGKEVDAETGRTILEVARANGVDIPTLCHVPALEPAAMCRLCTVELIEGRRSRLVTACNFPLRSEAEIKTDTPRLRQGRKVLIELLHTRCPDSAVLKGLAERYGADLNRFPDDNKECVVCGLCVRVCERIGADVLALSGRGVEIRVNTSFGRTARHCIGCGACAQICPVEKIQIRDENGQRIVIVCGQEASRIPLRRCASCGKPFGPVVNLSLVMERAGEAQVPAFNLLVCPACSRRNHARRLAERHFEQYEFEAAPAAGEVE